MANPMDDPVVRAKHKEIMGRIARSPEGRKKRSETMLGNKNSKGFKPSPGVREKRRVAMFGAWLNPEFRKTRSASFARAAQSPEGRTKRSEIMKITWQRPEHREAISRIQSERMNNLLRDPIQKQKFLDIIHSPEARKKQSESQRGDKHYTKREGYQSKVLGCHNHLWRGGFSRKYGLGWNESLKRQIRNRDDCLCQMPDCYLPENGMRHAVHHIDYRKQNYDPANLITLCRHHHQGTSNGNRPYWTEYFQELQRLRGITSAILKPEAEERYP